MATTPSKRQAESPAPAAPPAKKLHSHLDPVQIGAVSSLEEMDVKVLHFQNRKLVQRLEQRRRMEEDLRNRIEQLEKRQATDDALLCIVNRYWNQLDEDMRVVLQRFDWEVADESENKNESEALTSFLASLSTWDRSELDQKLTQRVQFSERAVGKILQCFDRLMQRYEKLVLAVKGEPPEEEKKADGDRLKEEEDNKDETLEKKDENKPKAPELDEVVREEILTLQKENKNLHSQNTALHDKHRNTSLQFQELQDKITLLETENGELQNKIQDLEYAFNKSSQREDRLDRHLAETLQKLKTLETVQVSGAKEGSSISAGLLTCSFEGQMPVQGMTIPELMHDLEEQRQLADSRLQELEKLQEDHKATVQELEKLKLDLSHLPESVIVDSAEYKCLQSQFSVLYNESMQMKTLLEETRNMLSTSKNTHLLQIEQMESEELLMQKKLRTEVIQLEDALTQVRKEYEMLRIEFEQNLVANEQTGPINREMRHLITSLQTNNQQLKGEVARYKKKWREAQSEMSKFKSEVAQKSSAEADAHTTSGTPSSSDKASKPALSQHGDSSGEKEEEPVQVKKERALSESDREKERHDIKVKEEKHDKPVVKHEKTRIKEEPNVKKERHDRRTQERHDSGHERERHREMDIEQVDYGKTESEIVKNMKAEHKKLHEQLKETRLLLDMYKGAAKDQRDKVQLMVAEKKMKIEMDEMRAQIRRLQENERKDRRRLADDDAMRKIKSMEEQISVLQSKLSARKQEEDALQNELEVTGQAFEDMQEQNTRLLQQLREKDDAVFKLMSERIKSNQIHKLLKEEKDTIADQMETLQKLGDCQNQVVQKLEEKEQLLQNNLATLEKELSLRQQAMEMHKRKAIESAQSAADLKLHLDKYVAQLRDTQLAVAEKSSSLEQENFKNKRLQEELATLRKKLERHKKMELANSADEVLLEEIRDLKEQLTCPSCKTKRKDAVFTKCFHVFCFECIKTRYDTRQRKCPKCNAGFGANDFHRLYLS